MFNSATKLAAVVVVGIGVAQAASAQSIQPGSISVQLEVIATGLGTGQSAPNFGTHTTDPRFLYVGQQNGIVRTLDFDQSSPLLTNPFLNIGAALGAGHLASGFEKGLIGGAFHPDFNNGQRKFYTHTSETIGSGTPHFFHQSEVAGVSYDHQAVIREWTVGEPDANGVMSVDTSVASRVVMRIAQPQGNHNGGAIIFGPDKYLYIALGDGGSGNDRDPNNSGGTNSLTDAHTNQNDPDTPGGFLGHGNGQDRRNVYGTILRIQPIVDEEDPSTSPNTVGGGYRIPNDNPFTEAAQDENPVPGWQENWIDEIYAYGLRNPFRVSFDRETDRLYAADVGQGTREEVNVIEKGGNYGWVAREGRGQNPTFPLGPGSLYAESELEPFKNPIADYPTGFGGGSATMGGFVYRGHTIGLLEGKYVFGDWNRAGVSGGGMIYMDIEEPGPNQVYDLMIQGPPNKPSTNLHGIAEGADGELYYLFEGQVVKLLPVPTGIAGDYNNDGVVDERDYFAWRASFGRKNPFADGNGNGVIDAGDYNVWRDNATAGAAASATVPEPAAALLAAQVLGLLVLGRRWSRSNS